MRKLIVIGIVATAVVLTGCNWGGQSTLSMNFTLHSASTSRALTSLPVWTKAEVQITEIVLDYDGPDGSVSVTEPVESVVNLLNGTSDPPLPSFELGPGTYESINFGAELLDDGTTPSILLEGTWEGTDIRVVFISGEVFEAVAGTLVVAPGESLDVSVVLNPDDWFATFSDTDLQEADVIDGVIEISENLNGDLFDKHFAGKVDDATQTVLPGGTPD